jgi:hypothetical protein
MQVTARAGLPTAGAARRAKPVFPRKLVETGGIFLSLSLSPVARLKLKVWDGLESLVSSRPRVSTCYIYFCLPPMRVRVRAAGVTTRVDASTIADLKAVLLAADASFWISLNGQVRLRRLACVLIDCAKPNKTDTRPRPSLSLPHPPHPIHLTNTTHARPQQTPLTGPDTPDDAPLATLGVRPGDLIYSATAPAVENLAQPAPVPPPVHPPAAPAASAVRGLTPGAAAHLLAASTGVPASLRAALTAGDEGGDGAAAAATPTPTVPAAIAAAAHACLLDVGFVPAWQSDRASSCPRLPPGWAPALTAPPLRYIWGPPSSSSSSSSTAPALDVRAYDVGAFTVIAAGLLVPPTGGGGGGSGGDG